MFAALCLAERGIRVRILDQYRRTALHSYGLALHPQSLRLLEAAGLTATIACGAHALEAIVVHHAEGTTEIDLAPLGAAGGRVAVLPQRVLEAALEHRLAEHGVTIEWERQLLTFDAGRDAVEALIVRGVAAGDDAKLSGADLGTERIRAPFLIGADGYDSLTRRLLRIEQTPAGPPITVGLLEFAAPVVPPERMHLVLGGRTTDVLWPLGRHGGRWTVELDHARREADVASLERRIHERSPWFDDAFGSIEWVTTVVFEPRLAQLFGRGRAWLAGDAARFTSPIGVQSMNIGLSEAHDLARRIARILRHHGPLRLLEEYDGERRHEWSKLLGLENGIHVERGAPAWAREAAPRLVRSLPASGRDLKLLLGQVGLRLD
jgi:4,5-epoxidase